MDNRRKQIVINQKFQHQYAIVVVAMTVLLTNGFIIFRSLFPGDVPLELTSGEAWGIGLFELVLVFGVWYGSLKASHKIAGPVFVITRQIRAVCAGNLSARVSLRQGDMFQDEAALINASLAELQDKIDAVNNAAKLLQQAQSDGGDAGVHLERLMTALAALSSARED